MRNERGVVLWPVAGLLVFLVMAGLPPPLTSQQRGVTPVPSAIQQSFGFDPDQSAGLFVGVREFRGDSRLPELPFAVDDAVDLAYLFSLELGLVAPRNVLLALSGEPSKDASKRRLDDLKLAKAQVHSAGESDLYALVQEQAGAAGPDGLLVVSFATHGISHEGIQFLAAETSLLELAVETGVRANRLLELITRSRAQRRVVLLDACRERWAPGTRSLQPDPLAAAAPELFTAMAEAQGQAILSAARPGSYAYEDAQRGNGVFTAALLDGLRCEAEPDEQRFIRLERLVTFVNEKVADWTSRNRPNTAPGQRGIEFSLAGPVAELPLARCLPCPEPRQPHGLALDGSSISVQTSAGDRLWTRQASGTISRALIADLEGDGSREVVLGVEDRGSQPGGVFVLDCKGDSLWPQEATAPSGEGAGQCGRLTVRDLAAGDLAGNGQVVALAVDSRGGFESRLCVFGEGGKLLSSYRHPGPLHHVEIGAPSPGARNRIVVAGVNEDLAKRLPLQGRVHALFMFDPAVVGGEAPPYLRNRGIGTQVWYRILPQEGLGIAGIEIADEDRDGRNEISVRTDHGHILHVSFDGELVGQEHPQGIEPARIEPVK